MATKNFDLSLTIKAIDKATVPLKAFNARIERLTQPFAKVGGKLNTFGAELGLPKVGKAAEGLGTAFGKVGHEASALGKKVLGLTAGASLGLYALVKSAVDAGSALQDSADRAGLTVDAYAQLEYVASRAGLEQGQFAAAMLAFSRNLGMAKAGTGSLASLLKVVSPALLKQVKGAKDSEAAFDLMLKAMSQVKDPARRAALGAAAFGDAGVKLAIAVADGTGAVEKQRAEFLRTAGSQAAFAQAASRLGDVMDDVSVAVRGLVASAGTELLPVFADLGVQVKDFLVANRDGIAKWASTTAKAITAWVKGGGIQRLAKTLGDLAEKVGDFIEKVGGLKTVAVAAGAVMAGPLLLSVASLAGPLLQAGTAVAALGVRLGALAFGGLIADLGAAIPMIMSGTSVMEAFNLVLAMNPIGLVVTAVAALAAGAYLVYKNWGPIKKFFGEVWDGLVEGVKKAWNLVEPYLKKIGEFFLKFSGIGQAIRVFQAAKGFFGGSDDTAPAPRPMLGVSSAPPPARSAGGENRVSVDFKNMPRGVRVTTEKKSAAPVDISQGVSLAEAL